MQRIKIPLGFIRLVINLFTDRYNSVITSYGQSISYKTEIGIDQGESLSSLLWVIYIDPLLTVLNKEAFLPYIIDSDPSVPRACTSTLAFMDDTTLISSSIEGLDHLLNIAQEFYEFNNTKLTSARQSSFATGILLIPLRNYQTVLLLTTLSLRH